MTKTKFLCCGIVGVGLCAGLGALFIHGLFAVTQPVVDASEQFLALLGQRKIAQAYAAAADGFRAQQDESSFTAAVEQLGLTEYLSATWHSRHIENSEGTAEGTVTTASGVQKPVKLRLIHEADKWKVVSLRFGGIDVASIQGDSLVPAAAELERMVTDTLLAFNQAVQAKDFTAFYGRLADVWKKETTPQRLQTSFQEFLDKEVDIGPIKAIKPLIAPAATVTDQGVLMVAGHYRTQPSQVRFALEYAHEHGRWKLRGISVGVGKAGATES
jgi:hypothetical protein